MLLGVGDGVGLNISIQNTHEIIIKADEQQIFLIPHIFLWVYFSLLLLLAPENGIVYCVEYVFKVDSYIYIFFVLFAVVCSSKDLTIKISHSFP